MKALNYGPLTPLNVLYPLRKLQGYIHNRSVQLAVLLLLLGCVATYKLYTGTETGLNLVVGIIGYGISGMISLVIVLYLAGLCLHLLRPVLNIIFIRRFVAVNGLEKQSANALRHITPLSLRYTEEKRGITTDYSYGFTLPRSKAVLWQMSITLQESRVIIPHHYTVMYVPLSIDDTPHFYLDSTKNGKKLLDAVKIPDSGLELESNFSKHFTVHYGKNLDTEFRYLLPPDRMERLLEFGTDYDFEFEANYCWVISKGYRMCAIDVKQFERLAREIQRIFD